MGPPSPHCRYAPALSTSHSPGLGPSSWAGAGPGSRGSGLGAQASGVLVLSAPVLPRGPASVLQPLGLDVPSPWPWGSEGGSDSQANPHPCAEKEDLWGELTLGWF